MKEQKANKPVQTEQESLQEKLMKMLDELPFDSDEEGGCGHGCGHDHHR